MDSSFKTPSPILGPHITQEFSIPRISKYFPYNGSFLFEQSNPPLDRWNQSNSTRFWPSKVIPNWNLWGQRVTPFKANEWESMRLHESIQLSTLPFPMNTLLMSAVMSF